MASEENIKYDIKELTEYYKEWDIFYLWREHNIVLENIEKAECEEYINGRKELEIEAEVLCELIKKKQFDEKIWLRNRLVDAQDYYKKIGNKELETFLDGQINLFNDNYF